MLLNNIPLTQFIRFRLQNKLVLSFILVLLIPSLFISMYTANQSSRYVLDATRMNQLERLRTKAAAIEQKLEDLQNDLIFLDKIPALTRLGDSLQNKAPPANIDEVYPLLEAILAHGHSYSCSVTILDSAGQGIARMVWENDKAVLTPVSGLENAAGRNYFNKISTKMGNSSVYVSGVELDRVDGKIIVPYTPVIRYGIPLHSTAGTVSGAIIMTVAIEPILQSLNEEKEDGTFYVVDGDGNYLINPDNQQLYGTMLNTGITLYKTEPEDARIILSEKDGTLLASSNRPDVLQVFVDVSPPNQQSIHWVLIYDHTLDPILADMRSSQFVILGIALLGLAIAVSAALLLTRSIVKPLNQLMFLVKSIKNHQWNTPAPDIGSQDEIGELARAFAILLADLRTAYSDLQCRTQALEVATEKANEVNRLKSEFLATMSHEMRTPLNAIIGFSELIISGSSGELNDKQSRQLVRVHANGLRLLSLIEDLLDLHKMERGNLEVFEEPFSPIDLADRLSARISNLIEHSGLRYQVIIDDRLPKLLIGDRLRIAQIVLHLLFNAFKFTKTGEVELTLKPLFSADRSFWTISVRDTGIGIPPAAQSLVFEIFRQADGSLQREFGGTGVGLAISRQLCHRMGGDITLLSEPGEGSTFTVILPMKVYKAGRQRQIVRKMERESYSSPGAEPRSQPLSIDTEKSQV